MQTDALNAYATGLNERQYSITVTSGLVNALTDAEMEAVLAHELTHIRNGDVRLMIIAVVIAGVVGFVAELVFRMFLNSGWRIGRSSGRRSSSSGNSDSKGAGGAIIAIIIAAVLIVMAWFLSQIIRFSLSRSREYLADAGAVELTKNPDAMIHALRKIEGRGELPNSTSSVMEMCVDNPDSGFVDLFATHPTVDKRVQALVRFAGGRDPGPLPLPSPPQTDGESGGEGAATESAQGSANPRRNPWPLPGPFPGSSQGPFQGPFQGPWGPR